MKKIQKFLEFNGKSIIFLHKNGQYLIALRPVCEALNIQYHRQYKNIIADPILGAALSVQTTQVPGDQKRKMVFLPEFYFYGWLFSVRSESKELLRYKWQCYKILYEFFHGMATERNKVLKIKIQDEIEMQTLKMRLAANEDYQRLNELKGKRLRTDKQLKNMDDHVIAENRDLWNQSFVNEHQFSQS